MVFDHSYMYGTAGMTQAEIWATYEVHDENDSQDWGGWAQNERNEDVDL